VHAELGDFRIVERVAGREVDPKIVHGSVAFVCDEHGSRVDCTPLSVDECLFAGDADAGIRSQT
jgi:hypothetical protein